MRRLAMVGFLLAAIGLTGLAVRAESDEPVVFACNEFPPLKMENSETGLPGFDVEFLRQAFGRSGVSVEIVFMPWARALKEASDGDVAGLCSCSRTRDRDSFLLYSEPLGKVSSGLFSLAGKSTMPPKTLADVRGAAVGVIRGYNLIEDLQGAGIENIVRLSSEHQAARMLLRERLDFYYGYEAPTRFYLKQTDDGDRFRYHEIHYNEYFSCFSRNADGAAELLERFNDGLRQIRADGTYAEILDKYR